MKVLKVLIILFLVAVIIGGGFGAYYILVLKDRDGDDAYASGAAATPVPDVSAPDFEKAQALRRDNQLPEAKAALEAFLTRYTDSPHRAEAEALLGDVNLELVFSPGPGPDKTEYIVRSGDSLNKVAAKTKSNPALIFRANNLTNERLQIGQTLIIPHLDPSVEVHLEDKQVLLLNHGKFFKSYVIRNLHTPGKRAVEIRTKVSEKRAFKNGLAVAFGSRDYAESLRSIILSGQPGYSIYGEPEEPAAGDKPPANGIGLSASDAEELQTLVNVNTPVTIVSE